jgi:hypothetical protein
MRAIQTIIQMGIANGVKRFLDRPNGLFVHLLLLAIIRERGPGGKGLCAFILTAVNPGVRRRLWAEAAHEKRTKTPTTFLSR